MAEGEVARVVNFDWSGNPEFQSIDISVVHCGEFYLYNLKDVPSCSLGYCGQSGGFTTVQKDLYYKERLHKTLSFFLFSLYKRYI